MIVKALIVINKIIKMAGETDLGKLLKTMKPVLNEELYVFCTIPDTTGIDPLDIQLLFREKEGVTIVTKMDVADKLQLKYSFVASWITLTVHSSLEAVGLTAAFSNALTANQISCNVVAGYYHDHIFVGYQDTDRAMEVLNRLAERN